MYRASVHLVDTCDIYAHLSPIYATEWCGIDINCGGHICFWCNTMDHFINGLERKEPEEAVG